jgi:hypothetical protein
LLQAKSAVMLEKFFRGFTNLSVGLDSYGMSLWSYLAVPNTRNVFVFPTTVGDDNPPAFDEPYAFVGIKVVSGNPAIIANAYWAVPRILTDLEFYLTCETTIPRWAQQPPLPYAMDCYGLTEAGTETLSSAVNNILSVSLPIKDANVASVGVTGHLYRSETNTFNIRNLIAAGTQGISWGYTNGLSPSGLYSKQRMSTSLNSIPLAYLCPIPIIGDAVGNYGWPAPAYLTSASGHYPAIDASLRRIIPFITGNANAQLVLRWLAGQIPIQANVMSFGRVPNPTVALISKVEGLSFEEEDRATTKTDSGKAAAPMQ